jgi:hypothetical protein
VVQVLVVQVPALLRLLVRQTLPIPTVRTAVPMAQAHQMALEVERTVLSSPLSFQTLVLARVWVQVRVLVGLPVLEVLQLLVQQTLPMQMARTATKTLQDRQTAHQTVLEVQQMDQSYRPLSSFLALAPTQAMAPIPTQAIAQLRPRLSPSVQTMALTLVPVPDYRLSRIRQSFSQAMAMPMAARMATAPLAVLRMAAHLSRRQLSTPVLDLDLDRHHARQALLVPMAKLVAFLSLS